MRLLVVNGNTNEGMTQTLDAAARRMVPDGVEVVTHQVRGGPRYIGSRETCAEAVPHIVARFRELANGHGPWDAGVLACFGEPGLGDVRRACDFPVVGMAESSARMAVQLLTRRLIRRATQRRQFWDAGSNDAHVLAFFERA